MQNEKILALLENIKKHNDEYACIGYENHLELLDMIEKLHQEIREANAKNSGKVDVFRACMNVLSKTQKDPNRALRAAHRYKDGFLYVIDGHRIIATAENIDLPLVPDDVQPFQFENILKDEKEADITFPLPTYKELKSKMALAKAAAGSMRGKKLFYKLGGMVLDANFLLDAIMATGAETGKTFTKRGRYICPLFVRSENEKTIALTLPVNPMYRDETRESGECWAA